MESEQLYKYESLGNSEIRILSLEPGSGEDPIHCSLEHISLQEARGQYEAISYVWGSSKVVAHIFCGGLDLYVTQSLHEVLKEIRSSDRVRILWADAICIHQRAAEHSAQVQLMGEIYAGARKVLVWLGQESEGCKEAFENLPRWLCQTPPVVNWNAAKLKWDGSSSFEFDSATLSDEAITWLQSQQKIFPAIARLFARPWWYRRWTVQEVVRAKSAAFLCGKISLEWGEIRELLAKQNLQDTFYYLMGFGSNERAAEDRNVSYENPPNHGFFNAHQLASLAVSYVSEDPNIQLSMRLEALIWEMRNFRCSDPRDHLYGLLGIVKGIDPSYEHLIDPDYEASVSETSTRLHEYFMHTNIRPLFHFPKVTGQRNRFRSDLNADKPNFTPSWASSYLDPHFRSRLDIQYLITDHTIEFKAGIGSGEDKVTWTRQPSLVLSVRGMIIGKVEEILVGPLNTGTSLHEPSATGWARKIWSIIIRSLSDHNDQLDVFGELVTCAQIRPGLNDKVSKSGREVVRTWLDCQLDEKANELDEPNLGEDSDVWYLDYLVQPAQCRQLCKISMGCLGWIPCCARVGDEVCIFPGEKYMFVIGPCGEDHHNLIGECYMQGLMFGEAMKLGLPERWVHLY